MNKTLSTLMVAFGAFLKASNCLSLEAVQKALVNTIPARNAKLIPLNANAFAVGYNYK